MAGSSRVALPVTMANIIAEADKTTGKFIGLYSFTDSLDNTAVKADGPTMPSGKTLQAQLAGKDPVFHQLAGVFGVSDNQGVMGLTSSDTGTGVYGGNTGTGAGKGFGVRGDTVDGVAVQGQSWGGGLAGKFIGNVEVDGTINGIDLVSRMTELEDKVKKLTDFITATNRQPVVDTRIYPTPELTGDNSRLFHGNGFSPGKVRVVITNKDGTYWDDKQALTASGSGFVSTTLLNIPSVNGPFFVAATDERLNPVDWSGLLWSNTVTILT